MMCCVPELFRHLHAGFRALNFGERLLCGPVSVTAVVRSKWSCVGFQLLVIYMEVCWCPVVAGMHAACVAVFINSAWSGFECMHHLPLTPFLLCCD